jgi:hypothetical protein
MFRGEILPPYSGMEDVRKLMAKKEMKTTRPVTLI